jgi:hypothetical protein
MEVFMPNSNVIAVESYINGLKNKDLSNVPFAPDVTFESPLTSKLFGKEQVVEFLSGLFPVIKDIRIKQHIVEGDYVATVFDFDTSFGVIPVFDCFRVSNGLLKEIRPYYDPRPITEAMKNSN